MMFTHPHHIHSPLNPERISGIGTRLMQEAEEIARIYNQDKVFVNPYQDAVGFYQKLGYKFVSGQKGMMEKEISQGDNLSAGFKTASKDESLLRSTCDGLRY